MSGGVHFFVSWPYHLLNALLAVGTSLEDNRETGPLPPWARTCQPTEEGDDILVIAHALSYTCTSVVSSLYS